jgi:CrcB protein
MLASSVAVVVGGALGSLCRFWLSHLFVALGMGSFPWATILANVSGSLAIGLVATLTAPEGRVVALPETRAFLMVGFCGGYTTFSSFSLQTLALAQEGNWLQAAMNVALSLVLCLVAVWLGHSVAMAINRI